MDRYIAEHNIQHFKSLLATELEEAKKRCIQRLLAEEEAKLQSMKQQESHFVRAKELGR